MNSTLLPHLQSVFQTSDQADVVFSALIPLLGELLQCDRCFLYLRHPHTKMGKVPYCWRRSNDLPEVWDADWKPEPTSLVQEDPMFAAAVAAQPSIYVEDVEMAGPEILNQRFEQENFGHRALVHAHLRQDGLLWGILQPSVFGRPRVWTEFDRNVITEMEQKMTPLAIAYVQAANP